MVSEFKGCSDLTIVGQIHSAGASILFCGGANSDGFALEIRRPSKGGECRIRTAMRGHGRHTRTFLDFHYPWFKLIWDAPASAKLPPTTPLCP